MRLSIAGIRSNVGVRAALSLAAALLLSACETTGTGPRAGSPASMQAAQAPPPEPPITRAHAAEQCWMMTEKGHASAGIDRRADIVTKCIDDKMKAPPPTPKS
jgi:hypothetical protein